MSRQQVKTMDGSTAFFSGDLACGPLDDEQSNSFVLEIKSQSSGLELKRAVILRTSAPGRPRGRISPDGSVAQVIVDATHWREIATAKRLRFDWLTLRGQIMANLTISTSKPRDGRDDKGKIERV